MKTLFVFLSVSGLLGLVNAQCSWPLVYTANQKDCPNTCDDPNAALLCNDIGPGCECPAGTVDDGFGDCIDPDDCMCPGTFRYRNHIEPDDTSCTTATICESRGGILDIYPTLNGEVCINHADCVNGYCECYNEGKEYVKDARDFCQWKWSQCRIHDKFFEFFDNANNDASDNLATLHPGQYVLVERLTAVTDGCGYKITVTIDGANEVSDIVFYIDKGTPTEKYTITVDKSKNVNMVRHDATPPTVVTSISKISNVLKSNGRLDIRWNICDIKTFFWGTARNLQYFIRIDPPRRPVATGLCGDPDGFKDDHRTPRGTLISSWEDKDDVLFHSWDISGNLPFGCPTSAQPAISGHCNTFQDAGGVLAPLISATPDLAIDIYDACEVYVCKYHDTDPMKKVELVCDLHNLLLTENNNALYSSYPNSDCDAQCVAVNEVYTTNKPGCENSCVSPDAENFCSIPSPGSGCVCATGHIRDSSGDCVPFDDCGCIDENSNPTTVGQSWLETGSSCDTARTCTSRTTTVPWIVDTSYTCTAGSSCVSDVCTCDPGWSPDPGQDWVGQVNSCTQTVDCSGQIDTVFDENYNQCPDTCEDPDASLSCGLPTIPGCTCVAGTILEYVGGDCIYETTCPCYDDNGIAHDINTDWLKPGSSCTLTSSCVAVTGDLPTTVDTSYSCTDNSACSSDQCVCEFGYEDASNGAVVDFVDQVDTCSALVDCSGESNTYYDPFSSQCPDTCEDGDQACGTTTPGCTCNSGYILDVAGGSCIALASCPCYDGNGVSYTVGTPFWLTGSCTVKNTCDADGSNQPQINVVSYDCLVDYSTNSHCENEACVCDDHYPYNAGTGVCEPVVDCSGQANTHFDTEYNQCPNTCENPANSQSCGQTPIPGCTCNVGYILDVDGGSCIDLTTCPCFDGNGVSYDVSDPAWLTGSCTQENTCDAVVGAQPQITTVAYDCLSDYSVNSHCVNDVCICDDHYDYDVATFTCEPVIDCSGDPNTAFSTVYIPCPDTCENPTNSQSCGQTPVPGCLCNSGYILEIDGGSCIDLTTCPCFDANGVSHSLSSSFWLTGSCTEKNTCDAVTNALPQITTVSYSCLADYSDYSHCENDVCTCDTHYTYENGACEPDLTCVAPKIFVHNGKDCVNTCDNPLAEDACTDIGPACRCPSHQVEDDSGNCVDPSTCTCDDGGVTRLRGYVKPSSDCSFGTICESRDNGSGTVLLDMYPTQNGEVCVPHAECSAGTCACWAEGLEYTMDVDGFCVWSYSEMKINAAFFDTADNNNVDSADNMAALPQGEYLLVSRLGPEADADGCGYEISVTMDDTMTGGVATPEVSNVHITFKIGDGTVYTIDVDKAKNYVILEDGTQIPNEDGIPQVSFSVNAAGRLDIKWFVCKIKIYVINVSGGNQLTVRFETEGEPTPRKAGITGLAGNVDGIRNDYVPPGHIYVGGSGYFEISKWSYADSVLYRSWEISGNPPVGCSAAAQAALSTHCDVFTDTNGVVGDLLDDIPGLAAAGLAGCEFAVCSFYDTQTVVMHELVCEYYQRFLDLHGETVDSRPNPDCVSACPASNEHYALTAPVGCENSCTNPLAESSCTSLVPGCTCDTGYTRDGSQTCIAYDACGCLDDSSNPVTVGSAWLLPGDTCQTQRTCTSNAVAPPTVTSSAYSCPAFSGCVADACVCDSGWEDQSGGTVLDLAGQIVTCSPLVDCSPFVNTVYDPLAVAIGEYADTCENPTLSLSNPNAPAAGCPCQDGYLLHGGACITQTTCPCYDATGVAHDLGSSWVRFDCTSYDLCDSEDGVAQSTVIGTPYSCDNDYSLYSQCAGDPVTGTGQCECNTNYVFSNGVCTTTVTCTAPQIHSHTAKSCDNTCDNLSAKDSCAVIGSGCECPPGTVDDGAGGCIDPADCTCDDAGTLRYRGYVKPSADCSSGTICESRDNGSGTFVLDMYPTLEGEVCVPHADCEAGTCSCYNEGLEYEQDSRGFCIWKYSETKVRFDSFAHFDTFDGSSDDSTDNYVRLTETGAAGAYLLVSRAGPDVTDGCGYQVWIEVDALEEVSHASFFLDKPLADPPMQYTIEVEKDRTWTLNGAAQGTASGVFSIGLNAGGRFELKDFPCDFKAYWSDTQFWVRIEEPRRIGGISGVGGNANGIKYDELTKDGISVNGWADEIPVYYYTWQINRDTALPPYCSAEAQTAVPADCDVYGDASGALAPLISATPDLAKTAHSACKVAVCLHHDSSDAAKMALKYAAICDLHVRLLAGNNADFTTYPSAACGTACGANAFYSLSTSACPNYCAEPTAEDSCGLPPTAGCECDEGYLLGTPAGSCITFDACQCEDVTGYKSTPFVEYLSTDCLTKYTCTSQAASSLPPLLTSAPNSCTDHSTCINRLCECSANYHADGELCVEDVVCDSIVGGAVFQADGVCTGTCADISASVTCLSGTCNGVASCNTALCGCPAGSVIDGDKCTVATTCDCVVDGVSYPVGAIWPYPACLGVGQMCIATVDHVGPVISEDECPANAFGCTNGACGCLGGYVYDPVEYDCDFSFCQCVSKVSVSGGFKFSKLDRASSRNYDIEARPDYMPLLTSGTYTLIRQIDPSSECQYHVYATFDAAGAATEVVWEMGLAANPGAWVVKGRSDSSVEVDGVDLANPSQYTSGNTYRVTTAQNIVLFFKNNKLEVKWYNCKLKCKYDIPADFVVLSFDGGVYPTQVAGLCGNCDGVLHNDLLGMDGEDLTLFDEIIRQPLLLLRNSDDVTGVISAAAEAHASFSRCDPASFTAGLSANWGSLDADRQERLLDICHATIEAHHASPAATLDAASCEWYLRAVEEVKNVLAVDITDSPDYCLSLCDSDASYQLDAQCTNTCENPNAFDSCTDPRAVACRCDDSFVQNGDSGCIPEADCGCVLNGFGYGTGVTGILDATCENSYSCDAVGALSLEGSHDCNATMTGSVCKLSGINYVCDCPDGWDKFPDPHYPDTGREWCVSPETCGANEFYSLEVPGCLDTCTDPYASDPYLCVDWTSPTLDPLPTTEGCMCLPGHLWKEGVGCVLIEDCGCTDEWASARVDGDVWKNEKCFVEVECTTQVEGEPSVLQYTYGLRCTENAECSFDGNRTAGCICKESYVISPTSPGAVGDWDLECDAPISCPPYAYFSSATSQCPEYCLFDFRDEACAQSTVPGCVCDDGRVFESEWTWDPLKTVDQQDPYPNCVPHVSCGCQNQDQNVQVLNSEWMYGGCSYVDKCDSNIEVGLTIEKQYTNNCDGGTCDVSAGAPVGSELMTCTCMTGYSHHISIFECHSDLPCPANSVATYHQMGACSDTCREPTRGSSGCMVSGTECVCDPNYYKDLESDLCVLAEDCQCYEGGDVHPIGTSWLSTDCNSEITCTFSAGNLPTKEYVPHSCGTNQQCAVGSSPVVCECMTGYSDPDGDGNCEPDVPCDASAIYGPYVTLCPASCEQPNGDPSCSMGPGCTCASGEVFYGSVCIPIAECECTDSLGQQRLIGDQWPTAQGVDCVSGGSQCVRQGGVTQVITVSDACPDHSTCSNGACTCDDGYSDPYTCTWDYSKCQLRYRVVGGNSGTRYFRTFDHDYGDRKTGQMAACEHTMSTVVNTASTCYWDIKATVRADGTTEKVSMTMNDQTTQVTVVMTHNIGTQTLNVLLDGNPITASVTNHLGTDIDVTEGSTKWDVTWERCRMSTRYNLPQTDHTWVIVQLDNLNGRPEPLSGKCGDCDGVITNPDNSEDDPVDLNTCG